MLKIISIINLNCKTAKDYSFLFNARCCFHTHMGPFTNGEHSQVVPSTLRGLEKSGESGWGGWGGGSGGAGRREV